MYSVIIVINVTNVLTVIYVTIALIVLIVKTVKTVLDLLIVKMLKMLTNKEKIKTKFKLRNKKKNMSDIKIYVLLKVSKVSFFYTLFIMT